MFSDNDHNDIIIKYLSGKLTDEERQSFETELESNEDLREELQELSHIYIGLDVYDRVMTNHIDSRLIAIYADNPSEIDGPTKKEIEDHLNSCRDCREELELCRQACVNKSEPSSEPVESIWTRIKDIFFVPSMALKPVWVVTLLLLAAIPTYFSLTGVRTTTDLVQTVTLEAAVRDSSAQNRVTITSGVAVLSLRIPIPALDNARYDFELYNGDGRLLLTLSDRCLSPAQNIFAFDIPVSYFTSEGNYVLKVVEITDTGIKYLDSYYFQVVFPH
ncbi:MAG: anti-sigma factor family protein [Candidatus Zixiibacteriota bacterium]